MVQKLTLKHETKVPGTGSAVAQAVSHDLQGKDEALVALRYQRGVSASVTLGLVETLIEFCPNLV